MPICQVTVPDDRSRLHRATTVIWWLWLFPLSLVTTSQKHTSGQTLGRSWASEEAAFSSESVFGATWRYWSGLARLALLQLKHPCIPGHLGIVNVESEGSQVL